MCTVSVAEYKTICEHHCIHYVVLVSTRVLELPPPHWCTIARALDINLQIRKNLANIFIVRSFNLISLSHIAQLTNKIIHLRRTPWHRMGNGHCASWRIKYIFRLAANADVAVDTSLARGQDNFRLGVPTFPRRTYMPA